MDSQKPNAEDEAPLESEKDPKATDFNPWDAEFDRDYRKNDWEFEF
jgi:hypothetical protein